MKKAEVYSKPSQLIKVESFPKMAIRWKPLTIFAKNSILDVWLGSEYASKKISIFFLSVFFFKNILIS